MGRIAGPVAMYRRLIGPPSGIEPRFLGLPICIVLITPGFQVSETELHFLHMQLLRFLKRPNMLYGYPFERWTNNMSGRKEDGG
jgi:hypothetical protein